MNTTWFSRKGPPVTAVTVMVPTVPPPESIAVTVTDGVSGGRHWNAKPKETRVTSMPKSIVSCASAAGPSRPGGATNVIGGGPTGATAQASEGKPPTK